MSPVERPPHLGSFPALVIATLRDLGLTQDQLERYLGLDARNIRSLERTGARDGNVFGPRISRSDGTAGSG